MKVVLLMSFIILGCCQTTDVQIENQLSTAINAFSNDLYTKIAEERSSEDLIISGMSAHIALALLSLGAGDSTLDEINKALYLPNTDFTKTAYKLAMNRLNNIPGVILNIANKIYVAEGISLNPDYKEIAIDSFSSDIENIQFLNPKEAAAIINAWVAKKTNNKIESIIDPLLLSPSTILALVNAIYYKGSWLKEFRVQNTVKSEFSIDSTRAFEVDMMNQIDSFNYADLQQWDAQALEMKYQEGEVSMVIILPNKIDGLANLEKNAMNSNLKQTVFDKLTSNVVSVNIPKFKTESSMRLEKTLNSLGMKTMFREEFANLRGLTSPAIQLFVSFVIQNAFIEVNEKGTEAAAVTIIGASSVSGMAFSVTPKPFIADHPFLYLIKTKSGDVLFMGRFGVGTRNKTIFDKKPAVVTPKPTAPATPKPTRVATPKPTHAVYPTRPKYYYTIATPPRPVSKYTQRCH